MPDSVNMLSEQFVAERHCLMGFIYGMVRDVTVADDLFQEVWLRLQAAEKRGEPIVNPAKWCRGVAKNLVLHYWREKRVNKVVADSELLDIVEQALSERPDYLSERGPVLTECIDQLPRKSRALLQMKYEQGLSFADIAGRLDQSVPCLKMAMCRVRRALRGCARRKLGLVELDG